MLFGVELAVGHQLIESFPIWLRTDLETGRLLPFFFWTQYKWRRYFIFLQMRYWQMYVQGVLGACQNSQYLQLSSSMFPRQYAKIYNSLLLWPMLWWYNKCFSDILNCSRAHSSLNELDENIELEIAKNGRWKLLWFKLSILLSRIYKCGTFWRIK